MTNKPIESFYAGNIEVSIWENQGEDSKVFHSVTAKRTYMDGNGQWKEAGTVHLLPQQIPDLVLALQKGYEHLRMGMRQRRASRHETSGKAEPEKSAEAETPDGSPAGNEPDHGMEGHENGSREQGFAEKVSQGRGGRRSR